MSARRQRARLGTRRGDRLVGRLGPEMGVRGRSVLVAVVVVLVALVAGGGGLVFLLQRNLESNALSTAASRSAEVRDLIRSTGVSKAADSLPSEARSGQLVQIVDPVGVVVGASNRLVRGTPMSPDRPEAGQTGTAQVDIDYLGASGDWIVVSRGVEVSEQTYVIQVAVSVRVQRQTVQTVAIFLLALTPVLLVGVGVAVWWLVGRALQSVERIRRQVANIDAPQLARRVPVPPTRDEVAALAVTMNVMLDRLEAAHRAQRSFVSDASHELRSPLATLTTAAELALAADEPTRDRLLSTIGTELMRMRTLVENLMTLARADARDLPVAALDVDLDDLVDAEARRLVLTSPLRTQVELEPARVLGDEQRLTQVLRNLVDNAGQHARSAVRLTLRQTGADAVLWVDNDGQPIPVGDRERVFDRFVRLDSSRSRDGGGSGLGLAIARTAVLAHGGSLAVVDAPDAWCRFELRLPLAEPPGPPDGGVAPQLLVDPEPVAGPEH